MWEILVSRRFAIRDEPNVRFRCSSNFHFSLVLPMKNTRLTTTPPPPLLPPHPLPFSFTVYTFKTSPCMPAPRAHVENTCARGAGIHRVFRRVTHHTHHTHHPTRDREKRRQRQGEKRRRKRRRQRRQDNRRENREDSCSVWWCMAVVCWCSDFLVSSVLRTRLLKSVKYDSI